MKKPKPCTHCADAVCGSRTAWHTAILDRSITFHELDGLDVACDARLLEIVKGRHRGASMRARGLLQSRVGSRRSAQAGGVL